MEWTLPTSGSNATSPPKFMRASSATAWSSSAPIAFKLHFTWTLYRNGQTTWRAWELIRDVPREAFVAGRYGIADLIHVSDVDAATLRARRALRYRHCGTTSHVLGRRRIGPAGARPRQ